MLSGANNTDLKNKIQCRPENISNSLEETASLPPGLQAGNGEEPLKPTQAPISKAEEMMAGYRNIANTYGHYFDKNNPLTPSALSFWRRGYFYTGTYCKDKRYQSFILLLDQLAQAHQKIPGTLNETMKNASPQADGLANKLSALFNTIQNDYYRQLQDNDHARIEALSKHYKNKNNLDNTKKNTLKTYYINTLNKKRQDASALNNISDINIEIKKLKFDIAILAQASHTEKAAIDTQLSKLRDNIHRAMKEIGHEGLLIDKKTKALKQEKAGPNSGFNYESSTIEFHTKKYEIYQHSGHEEKKTITENGLTKYKCFCWAVQEASIDLVAKYLARLVGFGEGGVALYGYTKKILSIVKNLTLGTMILYVGLPALLVFLGGALCNYFLFHIDTRNILRDICSGSLFKTKEGDDISRVKKFFIFLLGIVPSISAAAVYGALSFCTAQSIWASAMGFLLPLLHLSAAGKTTTAIVTLLAACPAVATAICLACVFFVVIKDIIVEDRIQAALKYFSLIFMRASIFLCDWKSVCQLPCALIKTFLYLIGEFLKIGIGLALNAFVTIASIGVFHAFGVNFFSKFMSTSLTAHFATFIACITAGTNAIFGADKIQTQINNVLSKDKTFAQIDTQIAEEKQTTKKQNAPEVKSPSKQAEPLAANVEEKEEGEQEQPTEAEIKPNLLQETAEKSLRWQKASMFLAIFTNWAGQVCLMSGKQVWKLSEGATTAITAVGMIGTSSAPMTVAVGDILNSQKVTATSAAMFIQASSRKEPKNDTSPNLAA